MKPNPRMNFYTFKMMIGNPRCPVAHYRVIFNRKPRTKNTSLQPHCTITMITIRARNNIASIHLLDDLAPKFWRASARATRKDSSKASSRHNCIQLSTSSLSNRSRARSLATGTERSILQVVYLCRVRTNSKRSSYFSHAYLSYLIWQ